MPKIEIEVSQQTKDAIDEYLRSQGSIATLSSHADDALRRALAKVAFDESRAANIDKDPAEIEAAIAEAEAWSRANRP